MSDNAGIEDSLASAFNSSFGMPAAEPRAAPAAAAEPAPAAAEEETTEETAEGVEDWKPGYDAKLAEWRAEADEAREKANLTRAVFEAELAAEAKAKADAEKAAAAAVKEDKERAEREKRLASALADETPRTSGAVKRAGASAGAKSFASVAAASAEDRNAKVREAWELVKGKKEEAAVSAVPSAAASQWEEISAPHSSVEDISAASIPASTAALSPSSSTRSPGEDKEKASAPSSPAASKGKALAAEPAPALTQAPSAPAASAATTQAVPITTPSLTLSIFTHPEGLTVSRVVAALGINLVLPFINGIMLGLGEITAREAVRVGRLWWRGERAVMGVWRRGTGSSSNVGGVGLSGSGGF